MKGCIREYKFIGCGGGKFKTLGLLMHLDDYADHGCHYHRIARDLLNKIYPDVRMYQENNPMK
jgi:hypothetical protein